MRLIIYILIATHFLSLQALAQDKKSRTVVIEFSESDRIAKSDVDPQVKEAASKQNFEATKIDAEILGLEEKLDKGVVYIQ